MSEKTVPAPTLLLMFLLPVMFAFYGARAQYTIHNVYGDLNECDTMTRSIYIVWWDKDFNFGAQVDVLLDSMVSYRNTCLNELLMLDPPNTYSGYYYNVYIHNPGNPGGFFYPYGWGNGQGTDPNGYPFLTLPNGVLTDWLNNSHETFHIFQYNANSPGFAYSGDSQWYVEASANWFAARQNPTAPRAFVEAESLVRLPHVPLWLSYGNFPATYPQNWQRYVHQYALALFLFYLTDEAGLPILTITEGFFNATTQTPQQYLMNQMGPTAFRAAFLNWAAHMTNDFDFIEPYQAATNLNEWNTYADPLDDNEYSGVFYNSGLDGWYSPPNARITTAWSFNTYKINNSISETYHFELEGSAAGSYGDEAWFGGKVLVQNSQSGTAFYNLEMINNEQGSFSYTAMPADTAIYFIVASMPQVFTDDNAEFQLFPYQISITTGISALNERRTRTGKEELGRYNQLGQETTRRAGGIQMIRYNDGSFRKEFVKPSR